MLRSFRVNWLVYKIQVHEGALGPSAVASSRELHLNTNCAPGEFVMTLEGLCKSRIQGNVQGGGPRPEITARQPAGASWRRLQLPGPGSLEDI